MRSIFNLQFQTHTEAHGYEAVQMSSLPSVVLPFRSPGASHEEALNVPPMTHELCDACHKICDSMLQFVGHVC